MTSKLTRERIELIANFHRAMTLPPSHDEIEELARMALAAMDSEPVAYADPQSFDNFKSNGGKNAACTKEWMWRDHSVGLIPLYRHAQPAPASEPVGYLFRNDYGAVLYSISDAPTEGFTLIGPVFSGPQPAPVVMDEIISELEQVREWILNTLPVPTPLTIPNARRLTSVINACRAAMLATAPQEVRDEK